MNNRIPKEELKQLAEQRLKEANILFENEQYDGSIYLAGYVVELALKARICKILDLDFYPPENLPGFNIHDYDKLARLSGLEKTIEKQTVENDKFNINWVKVSKWDSQMRYSTVGEDNKKRAQDLLSALQEDEYGIFKWLKGKW